MPIGERFNFEDIFFRDLTVCVLDTLEGQVKWTNRFTSGDIFVQVPFYYSLTGDERFLLDSFSDDIVSENRFVELNTDMIPRGHLTMTGFNIKSDEFANPNVWLRMVVENEVEIRKIITKVRAVPITVNYDLEILLSSEIDTFKCSQAIIDTLWLYKYMYFEYNFMNIDAIILMPDSNQIEMSREKNLTSDNNIKMKVSFTVETYYPTFRSDRVSGTGYPQTHGSGMSDLNGFDLSGGVSDYFQPNNQTNNQPTNIQQQSNSEQGARAIPNISNVPPYVPGTVTPSVNSSLEWSLSTGIVSYNIQYRITGTPDWITTSSSTNNVTLSGLSPSSIYEYQVQTVFESGLSPYTTSTNFVPSLPNYSLEWPVSTGVVSYNIQYRITGNPNWITTSSSTNNLTLSGLLPSSIYEYQVQTEFASGLSPYTTSTNFATPTYTNVPTSGAIPISAASPNVRNVTPYGATTSFYNTKSGLPSDGYGSFTNPDYLIVTPKRTRWFVNILKSRERSSGNILNQNSKGPGGNPNK
jgi:hypothetical protein